MIRKTWTIIAILLFVLFAIVAQVFALTGRTNPPIQNQVTWDSPQTKELFYRACADCHSNETKWPWYSKIPPVSLLIVHDVTEARDKFNISTPDMGEADEAAEIVLEGKMPPKTYQLMHPGARLTTEERQALAQGLQKTFGGELEEDERHEREDDD